MNDEIRKQVEQIKREWDALHESQELTAKAYDILINSTNELKKSLGQELITINQAIDRLRKELQKDKQPGSYYHTWQCNIANSIIGELKDQEWGSRIDIHAASLHEIANDIAINFLELLCNQNNENIGLIKQSELQKSQSPQPE